MLMVSAVWPDVAAVVYSAPSCVSVMVDWWMCVLCYVLAIVYNMFVAHIIDDSMNV